MRSLSGLLVLAAATMSVACTDALPTESIPSAPSATAAVIQLNRHAVGTAVGDTVRLTLDANIQDHPEEVRAVLREHRLGVVLDVSVAREAHGVAGPGARRARSVIGRGGSSSRAEFGLEFKVPLEEEAAPPAPVRHRLTARLERAPGEVAWRAEAETDAMPGTGEQEALRRLAEAIAQSLAKAVSRK